MRSKLFQTTSAGTGNFSPHIVDTERLLFRTRGRKTGKTAPDVVMGGIRDDQAPLARCRHQDAHRESQAPCDRHHGVLENKGLLEHAQQTANHSSPHTTKLYDRSNDAISHDESSAS